MAEWRSAEPRGLKCLSRLQMASLCPCRLPLRLTSFGRDSTCPGPVAPRRKGSGDQDSPCRPPARLGLVPPGRARSARKWASPLTHDVVAIIAIQKGSACASLLGLRGGGESLRSLNWVGFSMGRHGAGCGKVHLIASASAAGNAFSRVAASKTYGKGLITARIVSASYAQGLTGIEPLSPRNGMPSRSTTRDTPAARTVPSILLRYLSICYQLFQATAGPTMPMAWSLRHQSATEMPCNVARPIHCEVGAWSDGPIASIRLLSA